MAEAQTYLSKCISQKRSIYSNRTVSYMIVLLELLTVLLEYIDLFVIAIFISKNSYYYTNNLPIMLALCSMLSGTYYAHNYASIIGGSLPVSLLLWHKIMTVRCFVWALGLRLWSVSE